ncbi:MULTISPECIES: hypothetical protein [Mycobacteroides]|uniref:hypothetical protein n=1 Tax=Mycobacteroides TaxID=670516 RepID=UPI0009A5866C|nr:MULTISPECIES: hypothetical protein [Mycobacteroides]MBF9327923.1 hypothetical protein [Mycobacteroides chelonae]MBF9422101.1 hypothetical protein [Mycobacteroides chelonae]SLH96997.1 Uncharacterised protein [Mycobacteroides abscessus subsp. abscessus]
MGHKQGTSAGQWAGSIMLAGGLVGAFLAGQIAKSGTLAVGLFCLALAGLAIYLVSVVGQAAAANREMNPRPTRTVIEDYPDDDEHDDNETPRAVTYPATQEWVAPPSTEQATGPRKRGFLSGLGDGAQLPYTND